MSALRDAARRRLELNPITTSLGLAPQTHQTPNSALSSSSLSAPFGYNPSTYTPVSAARPYNPQQWLNSPSVVSDAGTHHSVGRVQDTEVVTPAPPPYSPPRSQRASIISNEDALSGISPPSRLSPANLYRSSPEPASNSTYPPPPPPPARARAGSSDRPSSIYNVSNFVRRPANESPRLSPESSRDSVLNVRRPVPISIEAPSSSEEDQISNTDSRPPAARRAASAGAASTPSSSRSRGSSSTRWEPGMPLPPPPPGPPPQSRSQSMTRSNDVLISPPTRRPPHLLSALGPVPPTPAGWVDEELSVRGRSPNRELHIDTSSAGSSTVAAELNSGSSSSGLARARAVRGEPKSIRERRTESKTRKSSLAPEEPSNNPWAEAITPSDIVVPSSTALARRPTITRSTPRSSRSNPTETPRSGDGSQHQTPIQAGDGSRGSTPRPPYSSSRTEAPTPPFSPAQLKAALANGSPAIPPKSLPTPPPQSRLSLGSPGRPSPSHLHIPNSESATIPPPPPIPSRPGSRHSSTSQVSQVSPSEQFARAAIERHQAFAHREAAASTDTERVRIFADFIVAESRLRREKYASAIDAMGSEILELTRDLFLPYNNARRESTVSRSSGWTPDSSNGPLSPPLPGQRSHRGSLSAALHENPQFSTGQPSDSGPNSPALVRPESTWWSGYMPSLSPIPSMSVSEALDGSDSRGRPSSRWWEISQEGRSEGNNSMRLERSKRESKYMGMPRELREALQYDNGSQQENEGMKSPEEGGPSEKQVYGPNEYPPEKVALHEQDASSPALAQTDSKPATPYPATPATPNPKHLDVSRLVTLPPAYPRHHPAVNNNHPDLTSIRTIVRAISDFTEVEATKSRFRKTSQQIQEDLAGEASKRRNSLRINIQREIESGNMSFADAAKIEATAVATAQEKEKEACRVDFELFQKEVVIPLNDLLMDRVTRSTELFTNLRSQLFVDAQEQSPNLTQEEGDEKPELLEKLTLLKWIFEAREQLHRELFDLLSDRNNRYRDMVITPYRLAKNEAKVVHAETFFKEDASKRKLAFEQEVLKRTEEFMDIIEENVKRGVEVQLSAFWDIAPPLSRLIEKIPKDLADFQIQIPASEYEENPSYHVFPMQYLHSMLDHCEKSTYQFIESQTNLLCLLHEVKGGVTLANCRLMRTQRIAQGEDETEVDRELKAVENDEEVRLTDDLKERVRCVEEQWSSSLGNELKGLRDRLMGFLMEQGGWDEDQ